MTVLEVELCVAAREPIGEGAQGTRRFVASHGPAVAARQARVARAERASQPILDTRQLQLVYRGGPEGPGRRSSRPDTELSFIVTTASPVISTRVAGSEERNVARRMAGAWECTPSAPGPDLSVWFELARDIAQAGSGRASPHAAADPWRA